MLAWFQNQAIRLPTSPSPTGQPAYRTGRHPEGRAYAYRHTVSRRATHDERHLVLTSAILSLISAASERR